MSKLEDYLKLKKIKELSLPKLYVVYSNRSGVEKPIEKQVVEIIENVAYRINGKERLSIDRYILEDKPFYADILRGNSSSIDEGNGSGCGDLWSWTYFSSFSKEEADNYYIKESNRVEKEYGSKI